MSSAVEASITGRVGAGVIAVGLARAARRLIDDAADTPVHAAVRLGIDQLFRRESPARRGSLVLAADALASLRERSVEQAEQTTLYDLVEIACLAAAKERARAWARLGERARATVSESDLDIVSRELERALTLALHDSKAATNDRHG